MKYSIKLLLLLLAICTFLSCTSCTLLFTNKVGFDTIDNIESVELQPDEEENDFDKFLADLVSLRDVFNDYYYYDTDDKAIGEYLLKAYVYATGDKYAQYYTPEEYQALVNDSNGELVGVGISIVNTTVTIGGYEYKTMEIISVFKDSPAIEAGVKTGDLIMYVGAGDDKVSVNELGYDKALSRLRGEEGTEAVMTVFRKNKATGDYEEMSFNMIRRKVITESVTYSVCTTDSRVGIVRLSEFDMTTPRQFTEAVDTLLGMGCQYFVFDVRNNPGGDLNSIIAIQSYFLNNGDLLLSIKRNENQEFKDEEKIYCQVVKYSGNYAGCSVSASDIGKYKDLKCAVLTNENTASAAELFTATMKDYGKGLIVGEKTYGKGCMQSIVKLTEKQHGVDGALRVTSALYFSASHTNYHEIGIMPDIEVELSEEAQEYNFFLIPHDKDNQLQCAIEQITK